MKKLYSGKAGIYKLTCKINNKVYVGKAVNLSKRLSNHKNTEKHGTRRYHLQHAIHKYGWDSFTVEILETFEDFDKKNEEHKKLILEKESYYIKLFDSTDREKGYNICEYSSDNTGRVHTQETKEKMRQAHLGKVFSQEHRRNISLHRKSSKASEEAKHNMSLARIGIPVSEETRSRRFGKPRSEETKRKIGLASLGRKLSEETKEKMRVAATGRKHTKETVEKILSKRKGYKHSEETKMKMSQAKKGKPISEDARNKRIGRPKSEETKAKIKEGNIKRRKIMKELEILANEEKL